MTDGAGQRRSAVILVKERNDTNLEDPYETTFQKAGYDVSFLPALEFAFCNEQTLLDRLSQPDAYTALVATSPRGAAAAITALTALATSAPHCLTAWQQKPFYVVGEGSAGVIARSTLSLSVRAIGGNAERLGAAIVADNTPQQQQPPPPPPQSTAQPAQPHVLILSGNLRRPELTAALTAAALPYTELTVYETRPNPLLPSLWHHLASTTAPTAWVCYFSPSGVHGVQRCLAAAKRAEEGAGEGVGLCGVWEGLRVAALGGTSASAVREAGWTVHAVAASPSPAQLLAAIQSVEQDRPCKPAVLDQSVSYN